MNELTATEKKEILPSAQHFLEKARQDMKDVGDRFFMLGCRLYEAQIYHYVEALGYESIEQLAETELNLGKSSTYNLINVFKRFCDRDQYGNYKTWVKPAFRPYKYSQLVEMEKALSLSTYNIQKEIPPETPVRLLKEYIKYLNKNPGDHKNLPEWKTEQEQLQIVENTKTKSDDGKLTAKDFELLHRVIERNKKAQEEPNIEQPAPVQTFGLPTIAEPTPTVNVPEPKKEKPTYNFTARDGVRTFLKDYENWQPYFGFIGSFFKNMFFYSLKNGVNIYACEIDTLWGNGESLETKIEEIIYFINDDKRKSKKITKEQFEKYCAKHKDEL